MSLIHPVKKVYITQEWGVNPDVYARFNLKGHNGIDYRVFNEAGNRATTGPIYAAHGGVVVEALYDANGYGYYLKIENDSEGSIYGHLEKETWSKVKTGSYFDQGDYLCHANNSGFSSGPHLHWGYYPKPRNRGNGYSGTINQLPLIKNDNEGSMPDTGNKELAECLRLHAQLVDETVKLKEKIQQLEDVNEGLKTSHSKELDDLKARIARAEEEARQQKDAFKEHKAWEAATLNTTQDVAQIRAEIVKLVTVEDQNLKLNKENEFLKFELNSRDRQIDDLKNQVDSLKKELKIAKGLKDATNSEIEREYWTRKIEFLTTQIKNLTNIIRRGE